MRLARDEAHVWSVRLASPTRRLRREESHRALRRILGAYLEREPQRLEFRSGAHGKPSLADPGRPLCFNLSHSGELALIAVTREYEVGVDLEREAGGRDFLRLARRGLDAEGVDAVRRAPATVRRAAFYAAWVRREAIAKCHGAGLTGRSSGRPVSVRSLTIDEGYAAAVALATPAALPVHRLTFAGL